MNNRKKILSVLLALVLALSAFTVLPIGASAAKVELAATKYTERWSCISTDVNGNIFVWEEDRSEKPDIVSVITEVINVNGELVLPTYLVGYSDDFQGQSDSNWFDGGDRFYFADDAFATADPPITTIDFTGMYDDFGIDRFMDNIDHFMEVCPELQTIIGHGVSYTKQDGVFCLNATPDEATPDESYIELNGGRLYYDSYDGSCSYTRAEGLTGDVVIPDHINGCPVVYEKPTPTIDDCPELTSLTVPDIGSVYISNCPKLKSITFLGEDPVIDGNYIKDCPNLERIDTPDCDDLRCENSLLCNGSRLILAMGKSGDYTIPGDITVIEEHAFSNCPDLNSVTIPASVTEWTAAFAGLEKLKEVTLCDGVTNIGFSAFFDCGSLEKINIPDSVNRIGYWAFMDCVNLKQINIPFSVTEVLDGAFLDCGLSEVTLYPEVTKIGERAFGFGGLDWSKNDDFVIKGVAGSAAEEYAIKCDFAFVPLTEVKSGDIDGDNEVSVIDVTFIQRKLADIPISFEFNDEIADVDGDKIVTILDVTMVQRWLVGLKTNSRVGDTILA